MRLDHAPVALLEEAGKALKQQQDVFCGRHRDDCQCDACGLIRRIDTCVEQINAVGG